MGPNGQPIETICENCRQQNIHNAEIAARAHQQANNGRRTPGPLCARCGRSRPSPACTFCPECIAADAAFSTPSIHFEGNLFPPRPDNRPFCSQCNRNRAAYSRSRCHQCISAEQASVPNTREERRQSHYGRPNVPGVNLDEPVTIYPQQRICSICDRARAEPGKTHCGNCAYRDLDSGGRDQDRYEAIACANCGQGCRPSPNRLCGTCDRDRETQARRQSRARSPPSRRHSIYDASPPRRRRSPSRSPTPPPRRRSIFDALLPRRRRRSSPPRSPSPPARRQRRNSRPPRSPTPPDSPERPVFGSQMCGCGKEHVRAPGAGMCSGCFYAFQRVGKAGWHDEKRRRGWDGHRQRRQF